MCNANLDNWSTKWYQNIRRWVLRVFLEEILSNSELKHTLES